MAVVKKNSYNNVAATLRRVTDAWTNNHPSYNSQVTTIADLQTLWQQLDAHCTNKSQKQSSRRGNTRDLKEANKAINSLATDLRAYIKMRYRGTEDLDSVLSEYGFVSHIPTPRAPKLTDAEKKKLAEEEAKKKSAAADTTKTVNLVDSTPPADTATTTAPPADTKKEKEPVARFIIPVDNDRRIAAIDGIIRKLAEPNNPITNRDPLHLQDWINLKATHGQKWTTSQALAANLALPVADAQALKKEAIETLERLAVEITQVFRLNRNNNTSTLRAFGFTSEMQ